MTIIRDMTASDIPTLVRWGNKTPSLCNSDAGWNSEQGLKRWLEEKGKDILLVAEADGKLAGMCLLRYMFESYYCDSLYVDGPYQSSGIGKLLLEETEKQMKANGVSVLGLWSHQDNTRAVAFYKKMGFKSGFSGIWMEKRLSK